MSFKVSLTPKVFRLHMKKVHLFQIYPSDPDGPTKVPVVSSHVSIPGTGVLSFTDDSRSVVYIQDPTSYPFSPE